jgi:hypothetical protein
MGWTSTHFKNFLFGLSGVFFVVALVTLKSSLAPLWACLGVVYLGIGFAMRGRERREKEATAVLERGQG